MLPVTFTVQTRIIAILSAIISAIRCVQLTRFLPPAYLQFELKEVLERQMAEKRERKEKEEQMRKLEEAREEEEELRFSVAQSGVSALSSGLSERNFSEGLDFYAGLEALATGSDNVEDNDDSTDALSNLLNR